MSLTYTTKTENDPTAVLACFVKDRFLYILDAKEVWLEFPDLIHYRLVLLLLQTNR
jgi:hypothetical protein